MSKRKAVIVDLEGTYADTRHRLHYLTGAKQDWKAFFANARKDAVVPHVAKLVNMYAAAGYFILFLTMRPDIYHFETLDWLEKAQAPMNHLFMRSSDWAHDTDAAFKQHVYETQIEPQFDVELVLEDRPEVVEMWNEVVMVPCLAVNQAPWVAQYKKECRAQALLDVRNKLIDYYGSNAPVSTSVRIVTDLYNEMMETPVP